MTIQGSLITFLGAIIMIINIITYFSFSSRFFHIDKNPKRKTPFMLICYLVLLTFFLIGYLVIGYVFLSYPTNLTTYIISSIFLFGSIFVYIGLKIQIHLIDVVEKSNLEMLHVLIAVVEARDPNLNGHSQNVANLTMLIYDFLPKEMKKQINRTKLEYAAILHDIGKLGIPESILNKTDSLTEKEYTQIKMHPVIGKNILDSVSYFQTFSNWVQYHHERPDGKGYYHLTKEQIPIPAQIISLADTYSAMTMNRSYRKAMSYEEATKRLNQCKNTQLNGKLVDLFLTIPKEKIVACLTDNSCPFFIPDN